MLEFAAANLFFVAGLIGLLESNDLELLNALTVRVKGNRPHQDYSALVLVTRPEWRCMSASDSHEDTASTLWAGDFSRAVRKRYAVLLE